MGTRSAIGVRVNGNDKLYYNQYDGYPTWMGKKVFDDSVSMIAQHGWDKIKELAKKCKQFDSDVVFTDAQFKKYGKYHEIVSSGKDMYALLRGLQGELKLALEAGIMTKDNNFIKDSGDCEWAYILNVDTKEFEIYKGCQYTRPKRSRYAKAKKVGGCYACELIHTIDLSDGVEVLFSKLNDTFWETLQNRETA